MTPPRLLLFDPFSTGHHAEHIRHLMQAWRTHEVPERLVAAVTPSLLKRHPDLQSLAAPSHQHLELVELPEMECVPQPGIRGAITGRQPFNEVRVFRYHRRILGELAAQYRPEHFLVMYADSALLALASGLRFPHETRVSGLLFRPSLHYDDFEATASSHDRVMRAAKRSVLGAALRNPSVTTLFSLDPAAVPAIRALAPSVDVLALPDPVDPGTANELPEHVRASLDVPADRSLALLFGALSERKGVLPLLDALLMLPDETGRHLSVVLAGGLEDALREPVAERVRALMDRAIHLVVTDAFVPDERVQSLVRAADLVLVPYQRHLGSSGVLIRAAAAQRPVLCQDYGLMGYQARTHRLGQVVDTMRPVAIAEALLGFVEHPARDFDPDTAVAFAAANTVAAYTKTILAHTVGLKEL